LLQIFNCPIVNLSNIEPPSADDEILISQIILSGFPERVAKKTIPVDDNGNPFPVDTRRAPFYETCDG